MFYILYDVYTEKHTMCMSCVSRHTCFLLARTRACSSLRAVQKKQRAAALVEAPDGHDGATPSQTSRLRRRLAQRTSRAHGLRINRLLAASIRAASGRRCGPILVMALLTEPARRRADRQKVPALHHVVVLAVESVRLVVAHILLA